MCTTRSVDRNLGADDGQIGVHGPEFFGGSMIFASDVCEFLINETVNENKRGAPSVQIKKKPS